MGIGSSRSGLELGSKLILVTSLAFAIAFFVVLFSSFILVQGLLREQAIECVEVQRDAARTNVSDFFNIGQADAELIESIVESNRRQNSVESDVFLIPPDTLSAFAGERGYSLVLLFQSNGSVVQAAASKGARGIESAELDSLISDASFAKEFDTAFQTGKDRFTEYARHDGLFKEPIAFILHPIVKNRRTELVLALGVGASQLTMAMGSGVRDTVSLLGSDGSVVLSTAGFTSEILSEETRSTVYSGGAGAFVGLDSEKVPIPLAFTVVDILGMPGLLLISSDANIISDSFLQKVFLHLAIVLGSFMVVLTVLLVVIRFSTRPLKTLRDRAQRLARGETTFAEIDSSEFDRMASRRSVSGDIARSLNTIQQDRISRTGMVMDIANGRLPAEIQLISRSDSLGQAFQHMLNTLNYIFTQAGQNAAGIAAGAAKLGRGFPGSSKGFVRPSLHGTRVQVPPVSPSYGNGGIDDDAVREIALNSQQLTQLLGGLRRRSSPASGRNSRQALEGAWSNPSAAASKGAAPEQQRPASAAGRNADEQKISDGPRAAAGAKAMSVDPRKIIALDDDDFGHF